VAPPRLFAGASSAPPRANLQVESRPQALAAPLPRRLPRWSARAAAQGSRVWGKAEPGLALTRPAVVSTRSELTADLAHAGFADNGAASTAEPSPKQPLWRPMCPLLLCAHRTGAYDRPDDRPSPTASGPPPTTRPRPPARSALVRFEASAESERSYQPIRAEHRHHWKIQEGLCPQRRPAANCPCCTPTGGLVGGDELSIQGGGCRRQPRPDPTSVAPRRSIGSVSGFAGWRRRVAGRAGAALLRWQPGCGSGWLDPRNCEVCRGSVRAVRAGWKLARRQLAGGLSGAAGAASADAETPRQRVLASLLEVRP